MDCSDVSPFDLKVVVQFEFDSMTSGALITQGANQAGSSQFSSWELLSSVLRLMAFKWGTQLQWLTRQFIQFALWQNKLSTPTLLCVISLKGVMTVYCAVTRPAMKSKGLRLRAKTKKLPRGNICFLRRVSAKDFGKMCCGIMSPWQLHTDSIDLWPPH